ncbi:MAG: DUF5927 domain-containing protein [Paracoccaceae bacterium]
MLAHTALHRAEQVIRHFAAHGCPVVVHVDAKVGARDHALFVESLSDLPGVSLSNRYRCEWGGWGLVAATQDAAAQLLAAHPSLRHVYLASGSCLPLRPIGDLRAYLAERADTDFVESCTVADVPWTQGGLDEERFTLRFPFSWRRQRRLFDWFTRAQRRWGLRRAVPDDIDPHLGSQWWCLTARTLRAILEDPDRPRLDRWWASTWIPDESYFQTLARRHAVRLESRSLTLSKFDFQGKPHIFYDDHLRLLRRSDCFLARKIWPEAGRLYAAFLTDPAETSRQEPNPGRIDRLFSKATKLRTEGRPGLWMQSRHPNKNWENGPTAVPYHVFEGFADVLDGWEGWLARATGWRVHGALFDPAGARFAGGDAVAPGALSGAPKLRDHDPRAFLSNLIWNGRAVTQAFQFGPADAQGPSWVIAEDPNATVAAVTGAWAVPLFRSGRPFADLRADAARLQRIEADHLWALRSPHARARVRIWTLSEFVEKPAERLADILPEMPDPPELRDLRGFGAFLQALKDEGMHPHLAGDFPAHDRPAPRREARPRPYLVR